MRHNRIPGAARAILRSLGDATPPPSEPEDRRLARLTAEIHAAAGAIAPQLLALIDRRSPDASPADAAQAILHAWQKEGEDRAKLVTLAMKTEAQRDLEKVIAAEVQAILRPFTGKEFTPARLRDVRRALVKFLRKRMPQAPIDQLVDAAVGAIDLRSDRLVVRVDGLADLLNPAPRAS